MEPLFDFTMDEEDEGTGSMSSLNQLLRRSLVSRNKQTLLLRQQDGSTAFGCVECSQRFDTKQAMELHLVTHNKEYRFICTICGTGLKRKEHLERHTLGHAGVRPHRCDLCGKAFKRKEHLNIHAAIHSGEKTLGCHLCDRSFHRKDHLQKHMQSHNKRALEPELQLQVPEVHLEPEVQVKLEAEVEPFITAVFGNADIEQLHGLCEDEAGPDPARPHACPLCPKTFKRRDHLKLHSHTHLKKNKMCSQCGKGFTTDDRLLAHMNEHLTSASLLESASWLDNDATDSAQLDAHVRDQLARRHACARCGKRFKRRQHLAAHQRVHERDLAIWCSLCNEGFQNNVQFEQHQCSMSNAENVAEGGGGGGEGEEHELNEEPDYGSCGEAVQPASPHVQAQPASQHVPIRPVSPHVPVRPASPRVPVPARVFVCKVCSKVFRRRDHYRIHLNIHTGHKSFFCPNCGKGFYRKDHLQKHMLVHSKERERRRAPPSLLPLALLRRPAVQPEITIHAPSSAKLRVPLQMKVPYEMVTTSERGERRALVKPNGYGS